MKNWKTTLFGCLLGAANAALPLMQTGTVDPQTLCVSAAIAGIGILAKDYNVTGGSVNQ
jgi:hypothetical protein